MKKQIAVLLVFAMVFGSFSPGYAAQAAQPTPGHGFTLVETGAIDIIGARTYLYVHDATGARVFHIANDDTNRAMVVSFQTPTHNNKGIPHILEHITISGSRRFPSPNLFFSLLYQTYSTNINAFVINSASAYLYASMSEEQLLLVADFLMDSVFFPLLFDYEMLFGQEAWRYELADADAPLNVTGIVYNEMRGLMDITFTAQLNMLNTLLPGTVAANNHGGTPEDILTLTIEELKDFHNTYYHPSNMIVFLYGNLDIDSFLELIGSYCDEFEFKEIYVEKGHVEPFTEPARAVFEFPSPMGAAVANNSIIQYAIHIGHIGIEMAVSMDVLALILGVEPSPLMQNLRRTFPGGTFFVSHLETTVGSNLVVTGMGLNEEDMDALQEAVQEALYEIAAYGFDSELVEAIIAAYEFSMLSLSEIPNLGTTLAFILIMIDSWGLGLDYFSVLTTALERVKAEHADGYFEAIIEELILNNPHRALVATVPTPGLREELDNELRQRLDEKRAGMTDEEVDELIAQNVLFAEMANTTPPEWMIESLNAVTVDTLPLEVRTYEINEWDHNGARILTSEAAVGGIYSVVVDFNAAAVPLEELHYLNLYAALLGSVRTENFDLPSLQTQMFRFLNGFHTSAGARSFYDFSLQPTFTMEWMGLNDDFPQAAALAAEILLLTDVTDLETISGVVRRLETGMRTSLNSNPLALLNSRAVSSHSDRHAFIDFMRGLAYFEFLSEALQLIEEDPDTFISNLEAARDRLVYLEGSAVMFAGNADGIEIFEENLDLLVGHLQEGPVPSADLSAIQRHEAREAIILDSAVQFNILFIPFAEIEAEVGLEYSSSLLPLMEAINDGHLTPEVRFNIGAYGVFGVIERYGIAMISFWDPAVAETFAAYSSSADFARDNVLSQSDMDRFIISVFGNATAPVGELTGAMRAAALKRTGHPENYVANRLAAIKTTTVEDFAILAEALDLAAEKGVWITAGSGSAINANAELFDAITYAFGDPGDEPRGISRLEFLQIIFETDMDGLYELAVEMGLILDIAGPFDPLTREELAFVLIMASGGADLFVDEEIDIADAEYISDWAHAAVITALFFELFTLDEYDRFNPQNLVSFEELWSVLN